MSPLAQFVIVGVGTFLTRLSAVAVASRFGTPGPSTQATLRLIAPAVLAAIVADQVLLGDGGPEIRPIWWIAGVAAGLVSWRWRSAGPTMAVGLITVWLLAAIT